MNKDTMEYLKQVKTLGSISRAAERLGVSQPAISAQIKKVEEQFDIEIFDRSRSPLNVTEEGKLLFEYLEKSELLERNLKDKLVELNGLQIGSLNIGGSGAFNFIYLPDSIKEFSRQYPEIDVHIMNGNMQELVDRTLDGTLDLFISSPVDKKDGVVFENLLTTKVYLCVPKNSAINDELKEYQVPFEDIDAKKAHPEVDLKKFANVPFIRLSSELYLGRLLDMLMKKAGLKNTIRIEADQAITSYAMTAEGVGVSLMCGVEIKKMPVAERPYFYMINNKKCVRDMYLAYRKGSSLSRAARAFMEIVRKKFTSYL
ncbi:MAG: LysR family transcriptional regulator [Lachnospiraceae bacterium]|nr:LysR family transcriptional regulator [Lachnospiraceae bacterium]